SYYLRKVGSSAAAVNLHLRQILIKMPEGATAEVRAQKEKLAEEVYSKLQAGADFTELEKIYSDLPDARQGQAAMVYKLADLSPAIRQAVEPLAEKEFTPPLETA